MNELIIFAIILAVIGITAVITFVSEVKDDVQKARRKNRKYFLLTHSDYYEDINGNLRKRN
jgi:hypothetical protein